MIFPWNGTTRTSRKPPDRPIQGVPDGMIASGAVVSAVGTGAKNRATRLTEFRGAVASERSGCAKVPKSIAAQTLGEFLEPAGSEPSRCTNQAGWNVRFRNFRNPRGCAVGDRMSGSGGMFSVFHGLLWLCLHCCRRVTVRGLVAMFSIVDRVSNRAQGPCGPMYRGPRPRQHQRRQAVGWWGIDPPGIGLAAFSFPSALSCRC